MRLSDLPWGIIAKGVGAAAVATGLVGTGYFAGSPSTTALPAKVKSQEVVIELPIRVIIDGREASKKARVKP